MKSISCTAYEPQLSKVVKGLAIALILIAALAVSAHAEGGREEGRPGNSQWAHQNRGQQRHFDRNWNNHEVQARRYWVRPYYQQPPYVYAPPLLCAAGISRAGYQFFLPPVHTLIGTFFAGFL